MKILISFLFIGFLVLTSCDSKEKINEVEKIDKIEIRSTDTDTVKVEPHGDRICGTK